MRLIVIQRASSSDAHTRQRSRLHAANDGRLNSAILLFLPDHAATASLHIYGRSLNMNASSHGSERVRPSVSAE